MAASDHEAALAWRKTRRYTRAQLSELTGYSTAAIQDYESGIIRGDKARTVGKSAMRRYRLCVAAIDHGLHSWDWGNGEP